MIDILFPFAADPYVMFHDGWYYATFTTYVNVQLRRARTLAELTTAEPKVIFRPRRGTPAANALWAPEIHRLDDSWFIYFAADDGENENHRIFVLENNSPDPFEKQFVEKGELLTPEYKWSIDGTPLEVKGKRYFLWSGWPGETDGRQDLFIARLLDPTLCDERRVLISKPTLDWERHGTIKVNEGPQVLIRGEHVHIIYSASHCITDHYCLGRLTARIDSDLMNAKSWVKHPTPVFSGANGIISPGHASFVHNHEDDRDWIVYHCARKPNANGDRYARAQPFTWEGDTPVFAEPLPPVGREH
jgi:GH43 family beta-xylosidase